MNSEGKTKTKKKKKERELPFRISEIANQPDPVQDCVLKCIYYGPTFFSVVSLSLFLSSFSSMQEKDKTEDLILWCEQSKTGQREPLRELQFLCQHQMILGMLFDCLVEKEPRNPEQEPGHQTQVSQFLNFPAYLRASVLLQHSPCS